MDVPGPDLRDVQIAARHADPLLLKLLCEFQAAHIECFVGFLGSLRRVCVEFIHVEAPLSEVVDQSPAQVE